MEIKFYISINELCNPYSNDEEMTWYDEKKLDSTLNRLNALLKKDLPNLATFCREYANIMSDHYVFDSSRDDDTPNPMRRELLRYEGILLDYCLKVGDAKAYHILYDYYMGRHGDDEDCGTNYRRLLGTSRHPDMMNLFLDIRMELARKERGILWDREGRGIGRIKEFVETIRKEAIEGKLDGIIVNKLIDKYNAFINERRLDEEKYKIDPVPVQLRRVNRYGQYAPNARRDEDKQPQAQPPKPPSPGKK